MASLFPHDKVKRGFTALAAALVAIFGWVSFSEAGDFDAAAYEEISWEQLMPESWQEENPFDGLDLSGLSDNDPAAVRAMEKYLEKRKNAPPNRRLQGKLVKIHGFVVPLEWENNSSLREFLLVPYFGACIHVPPPPQNQVIHVALRDPLKGVEAMDTLLVYGRINIEKKYNALSEAAYSIYADNVEIRNNKATSNIVLSALITLLCSSSLCFCLVFLHNIKNINHNAVCSAISVSAGVMSCIGISTVVMNPSLECVFPFSASFLFMSFFAYLLYRKNRREHSGNQTNRSGKITALAVAVHSLPEYFSVFSAAMAEPMLGLALGGAVVAHNIPLGFSIAFLTHRGSTGCKLPRLYLLFSSLVPAIAAILFHLFMRSFFLPAKPGMLFSCAGGVMASIVVTDLIPSAKRYGTYSRVFGHCCAGFLFTFLLFALFLP
jgi:zinc transporter ZupT